MLLWKQGQYASWPVDSEEVVAVEDKKEIDSSTANDTGDSEQMPWYSWPRPPGGFLDLGYVRLFALKFVLETPIELQVSACVQYIHAKHLISYLNSFLLPFSNPLL